MLPAATGSIHRDRLYSIAGEVALIAGQMAFDMGDYATARSYYKTAIETAAEAKDALLHAVALARSSFTYTESGQLDRALILVQRANDVAQHTDNSLSRAWMKAIEAEVHANLHDANWAETALGAAKEVYSQQTASDDVYWTGFNASRLAGYKGICLVRLGKPDEALMSLEQSLNLMETGSLRRRPRILTDMAFAHVQRYEIEEACRLASEALATSRATGNTIVISRLEKLHHALGPWRTSAAVRDFDEQLLLA
jgi:tetratricopeptide (TPR) repeat protein